MNRGCYGVGPAVVPDVADGSVAVYAWCDGSAWIFGGEGLCAGYVCVRVVRGALCGLCGEVVGDGRSADGSVRLQEGGCLGVLV